MPTPSSGFVGFDQYLASNEEPLSRAVSGYNQGVQDKQTAAQTMADKLGKSAYDTAASTGQPQLTFAGSDYDAASKARRDADASLHGMDSPYQLQAQGYSPFDASLLYGANGQPQPTAPATGLDEYLRGQSSTGAATFKPPVQPPPVSLMDRIAAARGEDTTAEKKDAVQRRINPTGRPQRPPPFRGYFGGP